MTTTTIWLLLVWVTSTAPGAKFPVTAVQETYATQAECIAAGNVTTSPMVWACVKGLR